MVQRLSGIQSNTPKWPKRYDENWGVPARDGGNTSDCAADDSRHMCKIIDYESGGAVGYSMYVARCVCPTSDRYKIYLVWSTQVASTDGCGDDRHFRLQR